MNGLISRRDLVLALLIAAWAHIGLFFIFVVLMASNLFSARIDYEKKKPEPQPDRIRMQMVYEEPVEVAPILVAPAAPKEPEGYEKPPAFVQTNESQESEKPPEETELIGERDTAATSDAEAVDGEKDMAALSGEEESKSDPKTFNSDFAEGEVVGASNGMKDAADVGNGIDQINQEVAKTTGDLEPVLQDPSPKPIDETTPPALKDELISIEEALAMLEEEVGDGREKEQIKPQPEKVEETMPDRPSQEEREAADRDGGFAPRSRKTRIAGVISANGRGSLDVANTAIGRYQGAIFKKLETAWQMENIRNRSLLAPGNVTLYFVVNQNGKVSRQKQMAMVGASGTQWGMILRALSGITIPKMPKNVMKDLEGDPLEIIVTFNYH